MQSCLLWAWKRSHSTLFKVLFITLQLQSTRVPIKLSPCEQKLANASIIYLTEPSF